MGFFFLSNQASKTQSARRYFESIGVQKLSSEKLGSLHLIHAPRTALPDEKYFHTDGTSKIFGMGTYYYKGFFAGAALPALLEDFESNPFSKVRGHFAFVISTPNGVFAVSDKCGLIALYTATDSGDLLLSSSVLAVAAALNKVELAKQQVLEFVHTEATYGGATIFKGIHHLDSAKVFTLTESHAVEKYQYLSLEPVPSTEDDLMHELKNYFKDFENCPVRISCDLSAGFDTRTIAAILENTKANFTYNTNTNIEDPLDHQIALKIAEAQKRPIRWYDVPASTKDYVNHSDWKESFKLTEMARGCYRSAASLVIAKNKAADAELFLGGYGGEIMRDKYSKYNSVAQYMRAYYTLPRFPLSPTDFSEYCSNLLKKFSSYLNLPEERSSVERIYFFERMKYWGGSRISFMNTYCYFSNPLMDYDIMRIILGIHFSKKKFADLQKRILERFSPELAKLPSGYGYSFESRPSLKTRAKIRFNLLKIKVKLLIKPFVPQSLDPRLKKKTPPFAEFLLNRPLHKNVREILGFGASELAAGTYWQALSQAYTIDWALRSLEELKKSEVSSARDEPLGQR